MQCSRKRVCDSLTEDVVSDGAAVATGSEDRSCACKQGFRRYGSQCIRAVGWTHCDGTLAASTVCPAGSEIVQDAGRADFFTKCSSCSPQSATYCKKCDAGTFSVSDESGAVSRCIDPNAPNSVYYYNTSVTATTSTFAVYQFDFSGDNRTYGTTQMGFS